MKSLIYKDEVYAIQGAVFDVYREMGSGFLEGVYQECLEKELKRRRLPFESQKELALEYKGEPLNQKYKPDLICYDTIIVELKSVEQVQDVHKKQLLTYLRLANKPLGLLINFNGVMLRSGIAGIINVPPGAD